MNCPLLDDSPKILSPEMNDGISEMYCLFKDKVVLEIWLKIISTKLDNFTRSLVLTKIYRAA